MKSLLLNLLIVGLTSSQLLFTPGHEYVYTYSGKILSGIPQVDSTFAGMSITGQVMVQATGLNTFKLAMRDVGFSTFNDKLVGAEPLNWRNVITPATTPLTDMYKQHMESAVEFMLVNGMVSTVKISSEEPQWSVNFKKALVATLKIRLPSEGLPTFWTVMEQGIEGKCENTYQVSELPEYLIHEYEQGMIKPELCHGKKFYQVMKARDITKCMERSIFLSSKTHAKCLLGNCDGVNTKSSITRYFGCGETIEKIQLHGMINEGELQQNVLAFNTEPVVTGTKQILKLVASKPITTVIADIVNPKTLKDILYEFPKPMTNQIKSHKEQKEYYQLSTMDPSNQVFLPEGSLESISKDELKAKIIAKITLVATQLAEVENFGKKEIPSQVKLLKTVVSVLTTADLTDVYNSFKTLTVPAEIKETMRTLFLDTVRMAGTSPCVMFLKEMIETEQLTDTEAILTIATLAHNIKTPTVELIDHIFELIKSPVVTSKPILKYHAHLVFATLLRKACLTTPVNEVFPEYVFGKMCTPDNLKISQVYIPHFVNELKGAFDVEKQMGAISVLGVLGHESVIPLLLNYIEGKVEGSTPAVRTLAIYCLADVTKKYRNILLPVYASLVHNPAETRAIRIAAFAMLMRMQPDTVHLQKLAVSTWFEKDAEMHKFIYSSLKALAQLPLESHPEGSEWKDLTTKAQVVLPLAKPIAGIISSTFNSYITGVLKNLQVGSQLMTSVVTGSSSQHLYHKTEYFLKQVQTTPIEFAVDIVGLKSLVNDLVKSISGDTASYLEKIHPEWKELIQKLEISPVTDAPFQTSVWARFSDDIQFVFATNFKTVDLIKEKVRESLKAPGKLFEKICTKTPINYNKVFETLPYQALVPSDLGFPIVIETQATTLVSLKGEVDVVCTAPSMALTLTKKAAITYSGYVGTVSPFTNELLVAGINEHRATNIPIKAVVEVVPDTTSLKIVMKQIDEITPSTTAIDMHHYHVKPFTAMKPLVFEDLTPIVLHKNTKVLRSKTTIKNFEAKFGQTVGLDMTVKVDTECDLYDRKTMMDAWANYNYNPLMASWFHFTETAIKSDGMPTARFHEYSILLNPAKSTTKEAELNLMLTLATKKKAEEAQIINLVGSKIEKTTLSTSTFHGLSLHESIKKLDSESAYAVNGLIIAKLIGGQPATYTYSVTAGKGASSLEHKWNLDMVTVNGAEPVMKMCVEGAMKYPILPSSDVRWKYFNHIGFGTTCDEYFVNVDGTTSVTNKQKQFSKISQEAKRCNKLTIETQKISQEMKYLSQESQNLKVQEKYAHLASEQLKACTIKNDQEDALDQAVIEITTSNTVPTFVYTYGRLVNSGLKALLFKYIAAFPVQTHTNKVEVKVNINQKLNTVTMQVKAPMDNVVYKNIRLPVQVQDIFPLIASKSTVEQSYEAVTGSSLYGKCVLGQGYVQTFDKKTYGYQVDQCEHIITSDCSKEYNHAVIAKEVNGLKQITVYHKMSKLSLIPYYSSYKLEVDGQEVAMIKNKLVYVQSKDLKSTFSVYWSADNKVILDTPATRVTYNGKEAIVEEKNLEADGSHCGLCGDFNNDVRADVKTAKGCIYESLYASALSYRVKTGQCALSQEQQQLVQSEEDKCFKFKVVQTPVSSLYKSGKESSYSIKKHSAIYQGEKLCISQEPVVQCVSGSTPTAVTHETVKFVCLPEGRVSKLYAERVERGESPEELMQQPIAFETKMAQTISCGVSHL